MRVEVAQCSHHQQMAPHIWKVSPERALVYHKGNLSRMFLIHLFLSHQNVGFKEAFEV